MCPKGGQFDSGAATPAGVDADLCVRFPAVSLRSTAGYWMSALRAGLSVGDYAIHVGRLVLRLELQQCLWCCRSGQQGDGEVMQNVGDAQVLASEGD
jgi:hypothetical protein